MRQHNPIHLSTLYHQTEDRSRGFAFHALVGLCLIIAGTVVFWPGGMIHSAFDFYNNQTISELQEQNAQLKQDIERLQHAAPSQTIPQSQTFNDLLQRIFAIEQHQNALIDAIKGPQQPKLKRTSIEGLDSQTLSDQTKLDLLNGRLGLIESDHVALAHSLTERSEKNARILSLMLNSVSDRLVPQRLFGKIPTGNKSNMGGPYIAYERPQSAIGQTTQPNPNFTDVVGNAIETMHYHARLYRTLINLPLARPLVGEAQYVSGFGNRSDPFTRQPAFHAGIDLKQNVGSPVISTGHGIVIHAGPADGYGNMVEIAHADGVSTRYGHLNKIVVNVGDAIVTGQKLGTLGSSGRSTGPHLHYETRIRDQAVNPIPFLQMGEQLKGLDLIKTVNR